MTSVVPGRPTATPFAPFCRACAPGNPVSSSPAGLTTTRAPFIESARATGTLYIEQPYELYVPENHAAWRALYARMLPRWEQYATERFREGVACLAFPVDRVPRLSEVNTFLRPRTGFQAIAVSGYIPAYRFFDCLRRREFPTTITIRALDSLDYLPEPDIFHDIAGHVPMHTDRAFADTLVRFGDCARTAALMAREERDPVVRLDRLGSVIRALARFFWYSVEFGLMRGPAGQGTLAYGSGLLSSYGEIEHAVESPTVERLPFTLERVIHEPFEVDHYQRRLFIVESFEHLFDLVDDLERAMLAGELNAVAGGEPEVGEADILSFVEAEL
jgi:phenylalanine-4-hydroxylase